MLLADALISGVKNEWALWFIHFGFEIVTSVLAIFLILLVLVQRGRGGGIAGALGGMGGNSAFGTKAGDTFTWITYATAAIWIMLAMLTIKTFTDPQKDKELASANKKENFNEEVPDELKPVGNADESNDKGTDGEAVPSAGGTGTAKPKAVEEEPAKKPDGEPGDAGDAKPNPDEKPADPPADKPENDSDPDKKPADEPPGESADPDSK